MKKLYLGILLSIGALNVHSQNYEFQEVINIDCLPVISQDKTGTCWSFSTSSFLESEIIRLTKKRIDLSEMYQVRTTYPKKAENFIMRQGKAQFSEGGLSHDVIKSVASNGLVPVAVYSGLSEEEKIHNHSELVAVLEGMVNTYVSNPGKQLSNHWKSAIDAVLDVYLGKIPNTFTYESQTYTPKSFMEMTKIEPSNYVTLTSFTHQPYYTSFILNIPDNFSNGSMYNLPLDEWIAAINYALEKGYTLALDCDVSENTFSAKNGIAFVPEKIEDTEKGLKELITEKQITPEFRQEEFENYNTTDDHLMHIVGIMKDQNGTLYYKVKNSWGTDEKKVKNGGFVYMSQAYLKLKAISVLLHKDGIDKKTKKNLGI